jgi:cellulose/xylan binding protein with CBM9 domain
MNSSNNLVLASYVKELVDPILSNVVWRSCEPVRIEHYWSGDPAPATRHAEARTCWSEAALHFRFVCEQNEALVISEHPLTSVKTLGLWDRDVCEVFLAPDLKASHRYYEFEAAPTGEWVDLGIELTAQERKTDWDYKSGMTAITEIEETQIKVAITIPWSDDIPKPKSGDNWGINLFRCVGSDEQTRYLAWRPTRTPQPNFHVPLAFGLLKFK